MNFIAATVELKSTITDPIHVYGLDYRGANVVVPGTGSNAEVRFRILCYDRAGAKLDAFNNWKQGTRALITGSIMFTDDPAQPLDLIVTTIETNIPQDICRAPAGALQISVAIKIGTSLDNSDVVTWLFMETHSSRQKKLTERVRKGRPICVQGYFREYRKDDTDSPYRAIVASDFTTRKDRERGGKNPQTNGSAAGYAEVDPIPDY